MLKLNLFCSHKSLSLPYIIWKYYRTPFIFTLKVIVDLFLFFTLRTPILFIITPQTLLINSLLYLKNFFHFFQATLNTLFPISFLFLQPLHIFNFLRVNLTCILDRELWEIFFPPNQIYFPIIFFFFQSNQNDFLSISSKFPLIPYRSDPFFNSRNPRKICIIFRILCLSLEVFHPFALQRQSSIHFHILLSMQRCCFSFIQPLLNLLLNSPSS